MSDFSLINAALTRTGNQPITSLTDGTAESEVAAANYEEKVKELLGRHAWRFATRTEALNRLLATPPEPWQVNYQLPNDVLLVRDVKLAGHPVHWRRIEDTIQVQNNADGALVATFVLRPPEVEWPPHFRNLVIMAMEAVFLRAIGERYDEAEARENKMERLLLPEARRLDSQEARSGDPFTYPIMSARRG